MPQTSPTEKENNLGNLLIVDDEPDIREILTEVMQEVTPNIQVAENGKVALEIIRTGKIDAVVSDISMPIMDGFILLTEVRRIFSLMPFVIVTSFGDKKNLLEAIRLNATDFIEKPFENEEVIKVMKKALTFGLQLREFEKEMELSLHSSELAADEVLKKKQLKRAIFGMKYGTSNS
jgi:DNA-binding NtrC family response regulator